MYANKLLNCSPAVQHMTFHIFIFINWICYYGVNTVVVVVHFHEFMLVFFLLLRRQGIKLRRLMTFAWPCLLPKQCVVRSLKSRVFIIAIWHGKNKLANNFSVRPLFTRLVGQPVMTALVALIFQIEEKKKKTWTMRIFLHDYEWFCNRWSTTYCRLVESCLHSFSVINVLFMTVFRTRLPSTMGTYCLPTLSQSLPSTRESSYR